MMQFVEIALSEKLYKNVNNILNEIIYESPEYAVYDPVNRKRPIYALICDNEIWVVSPSF